MGNNVEIRKPNAAMSSRQSYMLYLMSGVDVRETKLTKGEASAIIDNIVNGKCYHARVTLAGLEGSEIKRQDVHKSHRKDSKPRGYVQAMAAAIGEEEEETPAPKAKAKPKPKAKTTKKTTPKVKTLAEELGLEPVDLDNPRIKRMLEGFAAVSA